MVQIYQSAGPSSWPKIIARTYYYVRSICTYEKHQQAKQMNRIYPTSIRPEIEHQITCTMEALEEDLAMYSKGPGHPMIDRIGMSLK